MFKLFFERHSSVHLGMVIYEDNHLLVLQKQPGILSQADHSGAPDLLSLGKEYIRKTYNKPGNIFLGLVHRLDRNVGGVMVFAKTSKSASRLSEQIRNNSIKKYYLVVVEGITNSYDELKDLLVKDEARNISRVTSDSKEGKMSILTYHQLGFVRATQDHPDLSLLRVELKTGRSHQIRVQLSHAGYPIVGDTKYGGSSFRGRKSGNLALYAHKLEFKHPTKDEIMSFEAIPDDTYPWSLFPELFKRR